VSIQRYRSNPPRRTGLHEIHDIAIVSQLATILALDPEVGSRRQADQLIASFRGDAAKLAHACLVAARDLKRTVGKAGVPRLSGMTSLRLFCWTSRRQQGPNRTRIRTGFRVNGAAGFSTQHRRLKHFSIHRCVRPAPRLAANAWSEAEHDSSKSIDKTLLRPEVAWSM
jgi:hypothetical protein